MNIVTSTLGLNYLLFERFVSCLVLKLSYGNKDQGFCYIEGCLPNRDVFLTEKIANH